MGKKVHNAKARQNHKVIVDNSATKDIRLELAAGEAGETGYDEANALVLPSKKRQTKVKVEQKQNVRILSKKQRKRLQAIVDKKHKKENRAGILEELASVQIADAELKKYTSISTAQTIGLKKLQTLDEYLAGKPQKEETRHGATARISSIKGAGKRKLLEEEEEEIAAKKRNPNFVGLEDDDDDDDDDDSDSDNDTDEMEDKSITDNKLPQSTEIVQKDQPKIDTTSTPDISENAVKTEIEKPTTSKKPPTKIVASRPVTHIPVHRTSEIQVARLKLPILAEEQEIMEIINENAIIIIAGETGSGKTTQVPQFLYEAGYAENNKMIGITEPRRVAAIAMSKRIAYEMQLTEREVSYLIRFEGNVTPETRIKFMTDGVLLKEIESDFLLHKYSVIILDEAHERSAYTDILVGLLSRIVPLRQKRGNPLKLIVMSATLRVEDFTCNARLFKIPPPLIKVEARQFPVTIHFQKRTPANYVDEAFRKTVKIHTRLPEGGILIFVTGQQEVNQLVRKLRRAFPYTKPESTNETAVSKNPTEDKSVVNSDDGDDDDDDGNNFDMKRTIKNIRKSKKRFLEQMALPKINLDDYKLPGDDTEADMHEENVGSDGEYDMGSVKENDSDRDENDLDDSDEEDAALDMATNGSKTGNIKQPLWVLPLYSLLSSEKQNRIFQPIPDGCRFCVVSTNVAETSLTIPNIKYVVDSGRQKTRLYDKITGVSAFVVTFTSKASADQRAGRAGRISAGHCYRLYSSAVYKDEFEDFGIPDIQKKPVDDLMLQMRCMGIDRVINFPFPSQPDLLQLQAAEQRLIILGALERINDENVEKSVSAKKKDLPPKVTRLGQVISRFPVSPRFGKMLALSHQKDLLPYTVLLVAALSVQEVLKENDYENGKDGVPTNKWKSRRRSYLKSENFLLLGDPMVLLLSIGATEFVFSSSKEGALVNLCNEQGLRMKALIEVRKLRLQLTNEINLSVSNVNLTIDPRLKPPTDADARFLRQILLAGMGDRVARKVPLDDVKDKDERRRLKYAYNCLELEEPVYMSSSSVLREKTPDWVIYQEVYETQNGDTTKMFIRGITAIEPEWLLIYAPLLCNIRAIKEEPSPRYNEKAGKVYCFVDASYGKGGWELPLTEVEMPAGEKACCYFGMFLLNGDVCPQLAKYKPKLKVSPTALTKSWGNLNENITRFKRTLIANNVSTRQKLLEIWEKMPNFLLNEYHKMLYDVLQTELEGIWPPIETY